MEDKELTGFLKTIINKCANTTHGGMEFTIEYIQKESEKILRLLEDKDIKFTPGPWAFDGATRLVVDVNGYALCEIKDNITANGLFISAAPAMFEVVKHIRDNTGDYDMDLRIMVSQAFIQATGLPAITYE